MSSPISANPKIVIVGAGFGGLSVARKLKRVAAEITVIDRRNHHLFQPLLYQVATAGLSPADIAYPVRAVLRKQENTRILLADVVGVDVAKREVILSDRRVPYDHLVLATGAGQSYFGHREWERHAPGLKSVQDATEIRRKVLLAFEAAEMETDPVKRASLLRFVVVGGGPTGVELSGSIAELAHRALACDFRNVNPASAEILLVEAGPRILSSFSEKLSEGARLELERLGVRVLTQAKVESVDEDGVILNGKHVESRTVIWAAGVEASPAGRWLGAEMDRSGRVKVRPDLSVPGHPEIFVIGDTAHVEQDGKPLPGLAPVAMQEGRYVAALLARRVKNEVGAAEAFRYRDKGNLATVGRSFAVVEIGRVRMEGFLAWVLWLAVHIFYLIGFRNRVAVMMEWGWAYLTFQRGARLIPEEMENGYRTAALMQREA